MIITLNTLNRAVTEYSLTPHSITPTHMGDALGLYAWDDAEPVVSEVLTGETLWGTSLKKTLGPIYFSMTGDTNGEAVVKTRGAEYRYPFEITPDGESRAKPGKGIRENYLAFGFSNPDGAFFTIDQIEVGLNKSQERRV